MDQKLYTSIGSIIVFSIWLFIVFSGIKEYQQLRKTPGVRVFMTKKEIAQNKDPDFKTAIKRWKHKTRNLFILWLISGVMFILISIIIDRTIGFRNSPWSKKGIGFYSLHFYIELQAAPGLEHFQV